MSLEIILHVYFLLFICCHRAITVPPQTAPPPRMVNLCQATQTTIIAPNPMLQGALLMQQMQGTVMDYIVKTAVSGKNDKSPNHKEHIFINDVF